MVEKLIDLTRCIRRLYQKRVIPMTTSEDDLRGRVNGSGRVHTSNRELRQDEGM